MTFLFTNILKRTTLRIFLKDCKRRRALAKGFESFVGDMESEGGVGMWERRDFLLFILERFFFFFFTEMQSPDPKTRQAMPKVRKAEKGWLNFRKLCKQIHNMMGSQY